MLMIAEILEWPPFWSFEFAPFNTNVCLWSHYKRFF